MTAPVPATSARLSIGFAWFGHSYMHILAALYLTVVLALEQAWGMGYDELIRLWTLGSLMIGLGAPVAGWLGDRWSESRMMAVFFLLTGGGAIAAGLADGPTALMLGLAVLGLGASIYHPVGMSWIVKSATNRGKAMGYMGIFGSVGIASAALVAGSLTDLLGWRFAFLIPGAVGIVSGLALVACIALGLVGDAPAAGARPEPKVSRGDVMRAFVVLSVTMLCAGLMFNAIQTVMPKWFEERLGGLVGGGMLGIGGLVTAVYMVAAIPQVVGGHLADRFPLKRIYVLCLLVQVPLLLLAAVATGLPLLVLALGLVIMPSLQMPAENMLLARYTPDRHRGLAFGAKFVLAFGAGPLAVQLVALFYEWSGEFVGLLTTLAGIAAVAFLAGLLLPPDRAEEPVPAAVPVVGGAD